MQTISYQYKKLKTQGLIILISFAIFSSCNLVNPQFTKLPSYLKTKKKITSTNQLPELKLNKLDTLEINSISTLNRLLFNTSNRKLIPKMSVDGRIEKKTFERIMKFVDSLNIDNHFKILYKGTYKNDSIYKSLITPYFLLNYDHLQMQGINFNGQPNGIYLIVTVLENEIVSWGVEGGGGSTKYNNLFEFLKVENGKVIKYTGYSIGWPNLRKPEKRFSPRYKDLKWVIKQLYKE